MADTDYLLGHQDQEWARLDAQHALWAHTLEAVVRPLALTSAQRVLEVGCGVGSLLASLVQWTDAAVTGIERDPQAAAGAARRLGQAAVVRTGDLRTAELDGPYDVIVARWVFSFLPDVESAVRRLGQALEPGGLLIIEDYHHSGVGTWPDCPAFDALIEVVRHGYRATGGDMWVADRIPASLLAAGLSLESMTPHMLAGPVDSPPWRWIERFLLEHLLNWVERGWLEARDADAFRTAWQQQRQTPGAVIYTPPVVTLVGRSVPG